jgi:pyrrolysine biosynthesis protein PylC
MKLLCLGAGLQGTEIAYLALKAGWDITLVDRRKHPPASGLAKTLQADLSAMNTYKLAVLCSGYDLIVPAIEDLEILEFLAQARSDEVIPPLAFDIEAYRLSSSKIRSKNFFKNMKLPIAKDWEPKDKGPFIAKPSGLSGSRGVRFLSDSLEVKSVFPGPNDLDDMVVEQYLKGPIYSVEVTSRHGQAKSHQVTYLEMDDIYDCCKVVAPSGLTSADEKTLKSMTANIARAMSLSGLMDLEAVYHDGTFKIMEIDARFPSQTPITVFWSTGVNLLVELAACFVLLPPKTPRPPAKKPAKKVSFEQFLVTKGKLIRQGEHVFSDMGPVSIISDFMGSTEAIVAGNPKSSHFAATLITVK